MPASALKLNSEQTKQNKFQINIKETEFSADSK